MVRGLGHDRRGERLRAVKLRDVGLGDLRLLVVLREDFAAVLRAVVGALVVQLGRVVRHREIDLQDFSVGDLLRVERDLHRLGVAGARRAHGVVVGVLLGAAGIAGHGLGDALGVLEHRLHAPEAAAGDHRGLQSFGGRCVDLRRLDLHGVFRMRLHQRQRRDQGQRREARSDQSGDAHVSISLKWLHAMYGPRAVSHTHVFTRLREGGVTARRPRSPRSGTAPAPAGRSSAACWAGRRRP